MAKNRGSTNAEQLEPQQRLKFLIDYSNTVEVDNHVHPTRYYRSGLEMVRMANVYHTEGNLEHAYVLYLKFMTLFLEKIRKHPQFNAVSKEMKATNQAKLREVLTKAEKLKTDLLKQYEEEYRRYVADQAERRKKEKDILKIASVPSPAPFDAHHYADVKIPPSIDKISYPDPTISTQNLAPSAPPPYEVDDQQVQPERQSLITPVVDRSNKPDILNPQCSSQLRTVIVPAKVMVQFQTMAQKNTINNVETCGILAGKLAKHELIITHMILPKQKGTSDSCTTMNEEEIFDFQDQHNLITIGWIHTHPTQTAFLSSVDLHTHCPYQLLMPEAIAIVCAPRYNETGFFVLTPQYGLKFIANCRKSGFHPHPTEPPLFMVAEHARVDLNASLDILDLRK